MRELEMLLENFWIIKDADKELYYKLKDSVTAYKSFLTEKLGYQIIINPYLIKLEKLPGKAESWMGITDFDDKLEYMFLCLVLMFLEDRDIGEQFVLSQITEFIQGTCPGNETVDWTLYRHRRYVVKVLRFAYETGMIKVDDGDEQNFAMTSDAEVLYENTGLSRYFMRNFTGNIMNYYTYGDIENDEWLDTARDKGMIRRNRVYRRVVMSPAIYSEGPEDADYLYIKNYRNVIQSDLEKYLEGSFHVHRNGAFFVLPASKNFKDTFPENRAVCDIALQINALLLEKLQAGIVTVAADDVIILSKPYFETLLHEVRRKNGDGWSKEYREMKFEKLHDDIMDYLEGFSLLKRLHEGTEIAILPLAGKIVGGYPADFFVKADIDTGEVHDDAR